LTLSSLLFFTIYVVVIIEHVNLNHFQNQLIGKLKKTLELNTPQKRFFYAKNALQAKHITEITPQARCFRLIHDKYSV